MKTLGSWLAFNLHVVFTNAYNVYIHIIEKKISDVQKILRSISTVMTR
jgi:hypothetical protein